MSYRYELIATLFFPWILDFLLGHSIMASLIGALLWGMAVLLAILRFQLKEERLKKRLTYISFFCLGSWVTLWFLSFSGSVHLTWSNSGLRFLTLAHASLLAAGFGMVLFLLVLANLWIIKEWGLKNKKTYRWLPSLESLAKATSLSMRTAFWFWTTGLFFAAITALIRWQRVHDETGFRAIFHYDWLSDPKVVLSFAMWIPLIFCRFFKNIFSDSQVARYTGFAIFSFLFICLFLIMSSIDVPFSRHEALRWITR